MKPLDINLKAFREDLDDFLLLLGCLWIVIPHRYVNFLPCWFKRETSEYARVVYTYGL